MTQFPPLVENLSNVPFPKKPGTFGVCHGVGLVADIIRRATESWAGHAVMYVGNGQIVQATWPKVQLDAAPTNNVVWATKQDLTDEQRTTIVTTAKGLVGDSYDWTVYPALAAALFYAAATKDLSHLFSNDKWWDCSGLIAHCDAAAGFNIDASIDPHLVTPAELMQLGTQDGWF
jgi:uncharacterized protein YycO